MTSLVSLGLDLATAGARCVAMDAETGVLLASASAPLPAPVRSAGGVSRQCPDYAPVAFQLISQVCLALGSRRTLIRALAAAGTSGTVVPADSAGVPIGDARLYDDTSSLEAISTLGLAAAGSLGRMVSLNRDYAPPRMLSTVDVVASYLVGAPVAADTSHALKAGIDLLHRTWPVSAMEALGLPITGLPPLVVPGTVLGRVCDEHARTLGLPVGVLVVAGMTDGCAAQLSTGAIHPGDSMGVLGTTLVLKGVSASEISTADGSVYSHLSPDGDFWSGGASNTGAGVLAAEFPDRNVEELDRAAARRGPSTILRYPLSRPGERFPIADDGFQSLRRGDPVDEVDAYRAILEGVAFVERLGLETMAGLGVRLHRHTLAGGASQSEAWNTIRATILAPVLCGSSPEARDEDRTVRVAASGSAAGAAVLAAHACAGSDRLTQTVDRLVAPAIAVTPNASEADELERSYADFLELVGEGILGAGPADPTNNPPYGSTSIAGASAPGPRRVRHVH